MNQEKRKLQKIILSIAIEIKQICDRHNIPYVVLGGTQLGAIRHGGFIPWDDDFDIGMKRKDYERFIHICETELNSDKYFLQTENTEEYYAYSFGKIRLKDTKFIEEFSKNVPVHQGIFVDIFPYDNLPDGKIAKKIFLLQNYILKTFLWIKCGYGEEFHRKRIPYKFVRVLSFFISKDILKKLRIRLIQKYNSMDTKQCFTSDYPREHLENTWFETSADYEFEGEMFVGFQEFDEYLMNLYGNYMQLPPAEERKTHTIIANVDLGKYKKQFGEE